MCVFLTVPREKKSDTAVNGSPSGPLTELQVITSQELLHLGKKTDKSKSKEKLDEEENTPMLKAEHGLDSHEDRGSGVQYSKNDIPKITVEEVDDTTVVSYTYGDKHAEDDPEVVTHNRGQKISSVENKESETVDQTQTADTQEPTAEFVVESPALLNEVEKLFDAKRVSFSGDSKTTL